MNLETKSFKAKHFENENPMPAKHSHLPANKLEEMLIDAEADDETVQRSQPLLRRPWLLLLGLILVALNLRPALSSMAPMLSEVSKSLGLTASQAGLLTTLPVLCLGLFAPLAPNTLLIQEFMDSASRSFFRRKHRSMDRLS